MDISSGYREFVPGPRDRMFGTREEAKRNANQKALKAGKPLPYRKKEEEAASPEEEAVRQAVDKVVRDLLRDLI